MTNKKTYSNNEHDTGSGAGDYTAKNILNRFDYDLFDEEKNIVEKTIRVRRVQMPNKGERWKVMQDNKLVFTLEGTKVSKKEKEYLRTADGFNFLIGQFKDGLKTLNKLKTELKKRIK